MIQRVNLIEKHGIKVTYGIILAAVGATLLVCLLIYSGLFYGQKVVENQVQQYTQDIERLKKERDRLMTREEFTQGGAAFAAIHEALRKTPPWQDLLNSIVLSLPPQVWMVSLKTSMKADSASKKGVVINGQAQNPQTMARFISTLEESPYFEKAVLTTSKEEKGVFNFTVSCDISSLTR